jgi:hypothetical protein
MAADSAVPARCLVMGGNRYIGLSLVANSRGGATT